MSVKITATMIVNLSNFSTDDLRALYTQARNANSPDDTMRAIVQAGTAVALASTLPTRETFVAPVVTAPVVKAGPLTPGMYRSARTGIVRVYKARNGSHLLAKSLTGNVESGFHFEYLGAASRFVKASERMTENEARAFGQEFGTCCVCAALLTDPTSVAAGIGPVCASRI